MLPNKVISRTPSVPGNATDVNRASVTLQKDLLAKKGAARTIHRRSCTPEEIAVQRTERCVCVCVFVLGKFVRRRWGWGWMREAKEGGGVGSWRFGWVSEGLLVVMVGGSWEIRCGYRVVWTSGWLVGWLIGDLGFGVEAK